MSGFCAYETGNSAWNEFNHSNDHIVPCPINEAGYFYDFQSDSYEKPWNEVTGLTNNGYDASKCLIQQKDETGLPNLTRKAKMLEKGSWSCRPDGGLYPSCNNDSCREEMSMPSNDTIMCSQSFMNNIGSANKFGSDDTIFKEASTAVDNNICDYPLSHIPRTDNNISFLNNDNDDKVSNDFFHYEWPDTGNFEEELDQIFRGCDSTFGMGNLTNEDELCSFPSSHSIGGSADALFDVSSRGSTRLKGISMGDEAAGLGNPGASISDSKKKIPVLSETAMCQTIEVEAEGKQQVIDLHKKQPEYRNQLGGGRDRYLENGGSLLCHDSRENFIDARRPLGESSFYGFSSSSSEQYKHNAEAPPFTCIEKDAAQPHMNLFHPQSHIAVVPTFSSSPSENSGNPSPSSKVSSHGSNQVLSVDNAQRPSFSSHTVLSNQCREQYQLQDLQVSMSRNHKRVDFANNSTFYGQGGTEKQPHQSDNGIAGHSAVEVVSTCVTGELHYANAPGKSIMGSAKDKISGEGSGLDRLQQVRDQLDSRTKLCIRDSLYRLARDVHKRHGHANLNGSIRYERETNEVLVAEKTNKCAGLMDMESSTNPIDRSIAKLLFHSPPEPSVTDNDSSSNSCLLIPTSSERMAQM